MTAHVHAASGAPSPDASVVFTVTGANPRAAQAIPTNAAGQAVFSYTGANAGTDSIRAFVDVNRNSALDEGEPQATISHVFQAPAPATVALLPASGASPVGSVRPCSATVRDSSGAPLPGADVGFVVTGANPRTATAMADVNGVASFQYTGSNAGTDTIVAFADLNHNHVRDPGEPFGQATQTFAPLPGPQRTSVPDLEGATESQAVSAILAADLTVGTITRASGGLPTITPSDLAVARPERRRRRGNRRELPAREGAAELTLPAGGRTHRNRPQCHTMRGCTGARSDV